MAPDGSGTDGSGVCPYCETVANDFPSTAAWATSTIAQLRSWGFNSLGPYSDDSDLGSQMPYEVQLSMASGDGSPGLAVAQQYEGNPDGFLTALATRYFSVTTAAIRMYDQNHLILGVKAEGQEIEPTSLRLRLPASTCSASRTTFCSRCLLNMRTGLGPPTFRWSRTSRIWRPSPTSLS